MIGAGVHLGFFEGLIFIATIISFRRGGLDGRELFTFTYTLFLHVGQIYLYILMYISYTTYIWVFLYVNCCSIMFNFNVCILFYVMSLGSLVLDESVKLLSDCSCSNYVNISCLDVTYRHFMSFIFLCTCYHFRCFQ